MPKRESLCRLCGQRLSYVGPDKLIHWENGCFDEKGLVCESCRPFVKLQDMREAIKENKKDE